MGNWITIRDRTTAINLSLVRSIRKKSAGPTPTLEFSFDDGRTEECAAKEVAEVLARLKELGVEIDLNL